MDAAPAYLPKTPLMQQYFRARAEHPGVLLLMRVGDFYEAYGEDAETIASALNITLTGREDGGTRISMAGVPHHATERYVARLIRQGFRVALMDQVEDPKLAKGLVKRKVTRVMSRGTVFEDSLLDAKANNFLAAAYDDGAVAGLAIADVSTGEFLATEASGEDRLRRLVDELCRIEPAELLTPEEDRDLTELLGKATGMTVHAFAPPDASHRRSGSAADRLCARFGTATLRGFGCEEYTAGLSAALLLLDYLDETQTGASRHITGLGTYSTGDFMVLDASARRNLELTTSLSDGGRSHSLIGVLDETLTSMGGRLLRRWLDEPLLSCDEIERRLGAVAAFAKSELVRGDVRELLKGVNDIERLVSRASAGMAGGRDLVGLRDSLERLPALSNALASIEEPLIREHACRLRGEIPPMQELLAVHEPRTDEVSPAVLSPEEVAALIRRAIADQPPSGIKDAGLIRDGFSKELDELRSMARDGRSWIASLEADERAKTGISSLKVGYNAVFGYYLEVTKPNLPKVPSDYVRKQTTSTGERYITQALKEYEERILRADERALELEQRLFAEVRERIAAASAPLLAVARSVAIIDLVAGFAEAAVRSNYSRPTVTNGETIRIRAGRHPVVERLQGPASFVPNDCLLDCEQERLHIITGPNMSGKSTALRQTALITLMAQIGSFVPADSAEIGLVDRIFTRVGAHDELATGQSSFMVEMNECASILNNATRRSLVVLDEVGRGTSTYDGLSIAWAVAEHLLRIGCKALFATHYHYLNELAKQQEGVRNFRVAVKEQGEKIVWLHKLVPGGTDRSYGIQVARMAGVPAEVVERAQEILKSLERAKTGPNVNAGIAAMEPSAEACATTISAKRRKVQLTLFEAERHPALEELAELDVTALTPVEALMKLEQLARSVRGPKR
jgi:DNA mismatch repair protein MutS